jgi:predicted nucleic acid-binding protein
MGIAMDGEEWTLWSSPKLKDLTRRVLRGEIGQEFRRAPLSEAAVDSYLTEIDQVIDDCGGGCIRPRARVEVIGDEEDDKNLISLAVSVPAPVIITWDRKVLASRVRSLPTAEGIQRFWFVTPSEFVDTAAARRTLDEGQ